MQKQFPVIDLSKKTPREIFDFMQALMIVRLKLEKKGYTLKVKKTPRKKSKTS